MKVGINNRQAGASRGPGRPTKAELEARPEPVAVVPAPVVSRGLVCPACGRGMIPKSLRSTEYGEYKACSLCGARFRLFVRDGSQLAQRI